jgi:hypothetical protein
MLADDQAFAGDEERYLRARVFSRLPKGALDELVVALRNRVLECGISGSVKRCVAQMA